MTTGKFSDQASKSKGNLSKECTDLTPMDTAPVDTDAMDMGAVDADVVNSATVKPATVNKAPTDITEVGKATVSKELGGPKGLEPTRYGDWEVNSRCSDF